MKAGEMLAHPACRLAEGVTIVHEASQAMEMMVQKQKKFGLVSGGGWAHVMGKRGLGLDGGAGGGLGGESDGHGVGEPGGVEGVDATF